MGLTAGAIGTSFPNLFGSMLVAKQGLGNMAVSNAFGSNTFNIFIGLGFPWLLYIAVVEHGDEYADLRAEGIKNSIYILIVLLLVFFFVMVMSRWTVNGAIGYACFLVYAVFLVWAIMMSQSG
mmetsp:Transcript_9812/g.28838  ORF Transcript_9812/g.28838 Transcript_9812/m.28838 type:complete len:123 (+) Transcript_9812:1910-2278(+)